MGERTRQIQQARGGTGISRRAFLRDAGLGLSALLLPGVPRAARAATAGDRVVVVLFLRGGADALNVVVPRGDGAAYTALRRGETESENLALPPGPAELQLDGFFELHPSLAPLRPRFDAGELAIVHAVGGAGSYSHFEARDAVERAEPRFPSAITDGWLHRTLQVLRSRGELSGPALSLSGVAFGARAPAALDGPASDTHLAISSLAAFRLFGEHADLAGPLLEALYRNASHPLLARGGAAVFDAVTQLQRLSDLPPQSEYTSGHPGLNARLRDAARLIRHPELGTRAITLDFGSWDHHSDQNALLETMSSGLAGSLEGFLEDLGEARHRTLVLVVTEFGRTAAVNGAGGTDHGWGSLAMLLGGGVAGGRVLSRAASPDAGLATPHGRWPGLEPHQLHAQPVTGNPHDLAATTDFRDIYGEVLERFLGLPPETVRDAVLRGYAPDLPGLFS